MDWLIAHWAQILVGLGVFCAIGFAIKKYTDSTETEKDDWLGDFFGWISGFISAILGVVKRNNKK